MGSKNCNIMHSNTISEFIKTGLIFLSLAGYIIGLLLVLSLEPITTILGIVLLFFLCCNSYPKIRNNKLINYLYNLIIYVSLLMLFLYVSKVLIWFKIVSGNLRFLDVLIVLFAFILDLVLVAKIISVRSNWKTLFFKCDEILLWKTTLKEETFFVFYFAFIGSLTVSLIAFQDLDTFSGFEFNNQLLILIIIKTLFITLILFESLFFCLLLVNKYRTTKRGDSCQSMGNSIKFQFINSKLLLVFILFASIIFARFVSEQINDVLLENATVFDWQLFITSFIITLVLFIYFIISLNVSIFEYLGVEYDMDIKGNISIFIICTFLFINGVYLSKYLAIAIVYWPLEIPDPQFEVIVQQLSTLSGISYYDPIIIKMMAPCFFLIISIAFAIVAYLIFLHYTLKKYSLEIEWNFDQVASGGVHAPLGQTGQEIIRKVISKPLKNPKFIKYFSYLYYMFWLCTSLILSLVVTYLLVSDSMFGKNTFIIFALKNQYTLVVYFIFGIVLSGIFKEVQKIHKYEARDFIRKQILSEYTKSVLVYLPITISCLIAIFVRNVYQISNKHGNILAPESIQVFHCVIFLYTSGYVLLIVSKKLEEIFIKEIEE